MRRIGDVEILLLEADLPDEAGVGGDAGADEETAGLAFADFDEGVLHIRRIPRRIDRRDLDIGENAHRLQTLDRLFHEHHVERLVRINPHLPADDAVLNVRIATNNNPADSERRALLDLDVEIDDARSIGVRRVRADVALDVSLVAIVILNALLQGVDFVALGKGAGAELGEISEKLIRAEDLVAGEVDLANLIMRPLDDGEFDGQPGLVFGIFEGIGDAGVDVAALEVNVADRNKVL